MKYFLVGIKGSGMSSLAICLKQMNEMVIGSDNKNYYYTEENLNNERIPIFLFNKNNIEKYKNYIFIISYAYNESNNEEVKEIIQKGYKYYYYSDFINEYFKNIKIGISGTHGKTTISKLVKTLFNKDSISYIIGDSDGKGEKDYKYFIFEACEYKYHFIKYDYDYLLINNIEYDHPDYYNNIDEVIKAFKNASKKAKCIITNNDDINCKKLKHPNKYTYGINNKSYVNCKILNKSKDGFKIKIIVKELEYYFNLPFTGLFMVYNFLAAFTLYYLTHNNKQIENNINDSLYEYTMPKRRGVEIKLKNNNIIIDDFAHHPTEIINTYESIEQKYPNYNITIVFQPHTYSRTIYLDKEFKKALSDKNVYIAKTYPSREEYSPIKEKIVEEIFKDQLKYDVEVIKNILKKENQIVIFMGAGNLNNDLKYYI